MQNYCNGKIQRQFKKKKLDFLPSVSQNRETYAVSKFYIRSLLKLVWHSKHIFHDLVCKSKLLIYLMECRICHIQYIGRSETEFYRIKLDRIMIVRTLIDKTHHKQICTSNRLIRTLIDMLDLFWLSNCFITTKTLFNTSRNHQDKRTFQLVVIQSLRNNLYCLKAMKYLSPKMCSIPPKRKKQSFLNNFQTSARAQNILKDFFSISS